MPGNSTRDHVTVLVLLFAFGLLIFFEIRSHVAQAGITYVAKDDLELLSFIL